MGLPTYPPATTQPQTHRTADGCHYNAAPNNGAGWSPHHPAFKGKPRELTAADYAYGLKRLLDPAIKSPWAWLLEGKVVGGDEAREKAAKTGKFDYDAPLAGLEVSDRYTLKIRLKQPD